MFACPNPVSPSIHHQCQKLTPTPQITHQRTPLLARHPATPSADEEAALRQSLVFTEDNTDRESTPSRGGVYNGTTIPLGSLNNNKHHQPRRSYSPIQSSETSSLATTVNTDGDAELARGDPNELGIPNTSIHRWLPKAQRSLLQRQAELFVKPTTTPKAMQPINGTGNGGDAGVQATSRNTSQLLTSDTEKSVEMTNGNEGVDATDADGSEPIRKMQETDIF